MEAGGEINNETKTRELRKIFALFGAFQMYKHIDGNMLICLYAYTLMFTNRVVSSHVISCHLVSCFCLKIFVFKISLSQMYCCASYCFDFPKLSTV